MYYITLSTAYRNNYNTQSSDICQVNWPVWQSIYSSNLVGQYCQAIGLVWCLYLSIGAQAPCHTELVGSSTLSRVYFCEADKFKPGSKKKSLGLLCLSWYAPMPQSTCIDVTVIISKKKFKWGHVFMPASPSCLTIVKMYQANILHGMTQCQNNFSLAYISVRVNDVWSDHY